MYYLYSIPELVLLSISCSIFIASLIACLNNDRLNTVGNNYLNWTQRRYNGKKWFRKLFWGIFRFPTAIAETIKHEGWKAGLSISGLLLSVLVFAIIGYVGYSYIAGFNIYFVIGAIGVMAFASTFFKGA